VRYVAVKALGGREGPGVTQALLGCLTHLDADVRSAAVKALGGREGPEVTQALLGCLTDQDDKVRSAAVEALGRHGSRETLLILARQVRTLSRSSLPTAALVAEPLMIRYYRQIEPADQSEVLAAMGWLTTAALSYRSA
jgi:HEAT repeat protein